MGLLNNPPRTTGAHMRAPLPQLYVDIFQPGDSGQFLVEVSDPSGPDDKVICGNKLPPDYGIELYAQAAALLESGRGLSEAIQAGPDWKKSARYQDLARFGRRLYSDIFGSSDAFSRYAKRSKHLQGGMQFLLRLYNTASELWNIPWEYLHDGEAFLVGERGWPLARSLRDVRPDQERVQVAMPARPLNILVVYSTPNNAPPLNAEEEYRYIRTALGDAEQRGYVSIDFVEQGTLRNIDLALADHEYHVLHYTGHAAITTRGSCLILEDDDGNAAPANAADLMPLIHNHPSLQLILFSACRSGQVSEAAAITGLATEIMRYVPAVLTMQFALQDRTAHEFIRQFYAGVSSGQPLEYAAHTGRMAMQRKYEQNLDWGTPVLYIQRNFIRIVDPQTPPVPRQTTAFDVEALPRPTVFIGRREEQRNLRTILPILNIASVYIWGLPGTGKSALVRRIIERPGRVGLITDVRVIDCATINPRSLLSRISEWLEQHYPGAGEVLHNPNLPADIRLVEAARFVRGKRLILVLDRFDVLFDSGGDDIGALTNRHLHDFFAMLAAAKWSVLTLFTSRRYWNALPQLPRDRSMTIHLRELESKEVALLFDKFEHLRRVPPAGRRVLQETIGGHAGTIDLIETAIARDPSRAGKVDAAFVRSLVARLQTDWLAGVLQGLSAADTDTLIAASFLNTGFWARHVKHLAGVSTTTAAEEIMVRWEIRSVCDFVFNDERHEPWYAVPTIIRSMLYFQQSDEALKRLHLRAAEAIQADFAESADKLNEGRKLFAYDDENPFAAALAYLSYAVARAPLDVRERLIAGALDWRMHWIECGSGDKAARVVNVIWKEMAGTFGQLDEAESLLVESLRASKGRDALLIRASLVEVAVRNGKTELASEQYGALALAFNRIGDTLGQAEILSAHGRLLADKNLKQAIQLETEAMQLRVKQPDAAVVAESFRTLAEYRSMAKDAEGALKMADKALQFAQRSRDPVVIGAAMLSRGSLLLRGGNWRDAAEMLEGAIRFSKEGGDLTTQAVATSEFGEIHRSMHNYDAAAAHLMDAVELGEQLNDQRSVALWLYRLATVYTAMRSYSDAFAMGERALEAARLHRPELVADIQGLMKQVKKSR